MREYISFATMEQLLLTAITLPGSSIKAIAAATNIQHSIQMENHPQPFVAGEG